MKVTLNELLGWDGPLTHRQCTLWTEYLEFEQYNRPSRSDYYLMQLTATVDRLLASNTERQRIKDSNYTIKFTKKGSKQEDSNKDKEDAMKQSMQQWIGMGGRNITIMDHLGNILQKPKGKIQQPIPVRGKKAPDKPLPPRGSVRKRGK